MKKIIFIENTKRDAFSLRKDLIDNLSQNFIVKIYFIQKILSEKEVKNNNKNIYIRKINLTNLLLLIIDVVNAKYLVTFTLRSQILGWILKFFNPKIQYVPTVNGTGPIITSNELIYKVIRLIFPITLKASKHVFYHNNADALYFSRFLKKSNYSVVGGSGINLIKTKKSRETFHYPEKPPKIALFSRLLIDKGVRHYFEATLKIFNSFPNMKGNIYLAGSFYKANLKSNVITFKEVEGWVKQGGIFLGQPDNIEKFYTNIDIICLPSYREGISNVLLEGASYGCILLTSNVPGCIDVIRNSSGIGFKAKSSEAIYKAISKTIFLSANKQNSIRDNCYSRLEKIFSKRKVIKDYLKIIS